MPAWLKIPAPYTSSPGGAGLPFGEFVPINLPSASVSPVARKFTLLATWKSRTALPPLITTVLVLASIAVSLEIMSVLVRVIVPLHANKTVPPPAKAVFRFDRVQFVTVPDPNAERVNAAAKVMHSHN
jgi:hypothetical protein